MASSRTGPQNVPGRRRFRIVSNHILSAKGVAAGVADRQYLPAPEVAPEGEDEDTRTEANLRTELAAAENLRPGDVQGAEKALSVAGLVNGAVQEELRGHQHCLGTVSILSTVV